MRSLRFLGNLQRSLGRSLGTIPGTAVNYLGTEGTAYNGCGEKDRSMLRSAYNGFVEQDRSMLRCIRKWTIPGTGLRTLGIVQDWVVGDSLSA